MINKRAYDFTQVDIGTLDKAVERKKTKYGFIYGDLIGALAVDHAINMHPSFSSNLKGLVNLQNLCA